MIPATLAERLTAIRLLVLDVDGVLTDGRIIVNDLGVESKHFHVRDGAAIALWNKQGRRTAILSGRSARCVDLRAAELAIDPVVQGSTAKGEALRTMIAGLDLRFDQVAFMGDDLADIPALQLAGFAACPADAAPEVRAVAHFVAAGAGGQGAVREVLELLLKSQGLWPIDRSAPSPAT